MLQRYKELQDIIAILGMDELSRGGQAGRRRARAGSSASSRSRSSWPSSSPASPGKYVKLEDTISSASSGCSRGEFDHLPEQAFYMVGGIDEAVEKAKKLGELVMQVTVISPEASMFDGEADAVVAPAFDGEVGILPNHAPFMTLLGRGYADACGERGQVQSVRRSWWVPPGRGQPGPRGGRTRTRRISCVVASAVGSWCSPCSPVPVGTVGGAGDGHAGLQGALPGLRQPRVRRLALRSGRRRRASRSRASTATARAANDFSVRGGFADLQRPGGTTLPPRRRLPHPGA